MIRGTQRLLAAAALTVVGVVGAGAGTASAGEITGNGKLKDVKGKSICAYSGQNDGYHIPKLAEDDFDAAQRVQSFGQIVRHGGIKALPAFLRPGSACNPTVPFPDEEH